MRCIETHYHEPKTIHVEINGRLVEITCRSELPSSEGSSNKVEMSIKSFYYRKIDLSPNPLTVFGDVDVLLKMKLPYISKDFFDQNLPKELQKYVPRLYREEIINKEQEVQKYGIIDADPFYPLTPH